MDSNQSAKHELLSKLRQIAQTLPTPIVVYFGERILANLNRLQNQLAHLHIRVSLKAAGSPHVLRCLRDRDVEIDVSSYQEYEAAASFGIASSRVAYYSPGAEGMLLVDLSRQGARVLLDTWGQVETFCRTGRGQHVGLRVLCETQLRQDEGQVDCASSPKFGIPRNQIRQAASQLAASGVKVVELAGHLGSGIQTVEPYIRLAAELSVAARDIESVSVLNLGGGFAPVFATTPLPELPRLDAAVSAFVNSASRPLRVVVEPGRRIFADAATIIASVKGVKTSGAESLVISDARFAAAGQPTELRPLHGRSGEAEFAVYGDSCSPFDYIGRLQCDRLRENDKFVVFDIGAYAMQLCGHLQLRPKGTEVYVAESGAWEISRRALTTEDFLRLLV